MAWIDIKGHQEAIQFLIGAAKRDRLAQSLLFLGPEGVGKKLVALEFAKFLLCKSPQADQACEHCPSCLGVASSNHPDLHIIAQESMEWIKIDQVREFQSQAYLSAYSSKYKVFIIDNAHMLTLEAANSLLKLMEEPPRGSLIILITNKIDSCPATIVSRCQRIYFSSLKLQEVCEFLTQNQGLDSRKASLLAHFSQGSIQQALSFLSQEGFSDNRERILEMLAPKSANRAPNFVAELDRKQSQVTIEMMLLLFRDILLLKIGLKEKSLFFTEDTRSVSSLVERLGLSSVEACLEDIFQAYELNRANANPKILMSWLIGQLRGRMGVAHAG